MFEIMHVISTAGIVITVVTAVVVEGSCLSERCKNNLLYLIVLHKE